MSERDPDMSGGGRIRRSPGISYQELLEADSRAVPPHLRIDTAQFLGDHDIPIERYIDPRFHELEKERLWPKVWQMALREERIPEVGDADVYEIADVSIALNELAAALRALAPLGPRGEPLARLGRFVVERDR